MTHEQYLLALGEMSSGWVNLELIATYIISFWLIYAWKQLIVLLWSSQRNRTDNKNGTWLELLLFHWEFSKKEHRKLLWNQMCTVQNLATVQRQTRKGVWEPLNMLFILFVPLFLQKGQTFKNAEGLPRSLTWFIILVFLVASHIVVC